MTGTPRARPRALPVVLVLVAGCGRVGFVPGVSASPDGAVSTDTVLDTGPLCDPNAPFGLPVVITELSSTVNDGSLRLFSDELSGYYWSGTAGAVDIYRVSRPAIDAPFSISAVSGLNSDLVNDLDPAFPDDGAFMVFRRSGVGDDLFIAARSAPDSFLPPAALSMLNTGSSEAQTFIPIGRDELYFQSRRTAQGDIYRTSLSQISTATPVEVSELSTADEEGDPVVTPDGLTIYFRSNRPAALADFNIYVATRATVNEPFGPATLVDNVNTDAEEGPSWISPDGCRLYLTRNVSGDYDIYVATRGFPI